jgi:solute carrier family 25 carnitine/acylcarnitine transporter 20/29
MKKLISGSLGGFLQTSVSHPFDLAKSRVQTGKAPSVGAAFRDLLKNEGLIALYKGSSPVLLGNGAFNASLFFANQAATVIVKQTLGLDPAKPLSIPLICVAGIMAAPVCCAVLTPVDRVKVQLQLQRENKATAQYKGMVDCAVQIYKKYGLKKGLFAHFWCVTSTRFFGLPGYFTGAAVGERWWDKNVGIESRLARGAFVGFVAGNGFWLLALPADTCKQIVLGQPLGGQQRSAREVAREIYVQGGVRAFWRWPALSASLLRSAFANPAVFAGIYLSEGWMKDNFGW